MFIVLSASKTSHSVGVLCGDLSTVYSGSHMPFQTIVTHGTPPECDVGATQCYKHAAPPERRMIFASGSKKHIGQQNDKLKHIRHQTRNWNLSFTVSDTYRAARSHKSPQG